MNREEFEFNKLELVEQVGSGIGKNKGRENRRGGIPENGKV